MLHMKTVAIIQARMTSTRLPGKVLADVAGLPMLLRVVNRARRSTTLDLVGVATTTNATDDELVQLCNASNIPCYRGSEDDVLDRYYQAAAALSSDVIVRITSDCPLLDTRVVDKVVGAFRAADCDYAANVIEPTYPDGLDTEVMSRAALARAWRDARLKSEREHVTPFLRNHPELFRLASVKHDEDLSHLRWTVDEPRDLEFVRAVYARLGSQEFGLSETLALLREDPALRELNAGINRNEGFAKSLREDALMRQETKK